MYKRRKEHAWPQQESKVSNILDESVSGKEESEQSTLANSYIAPLTFQLPEFKAQLFDLKQFPLFELDRALDAASGKKEALESQLHQLLSLLSNEEMGLKQAASTCNWSIVGNLACHLIVNSSCCGTTRLNYACYYVEHYCKEGASSSLLEKLCEQLLTIMQETKEGLLDWLKQKNRFSRPSISTSAEDGLGRDLPDSEEQLFELEQYPLLDIAKGIETVGSEVTLSEILKGMIDIIPEHKAELQEAYRADDWDKIEKLAHKVKGGAEYSGTLRMKYACMYLERYRKAGHSASLEKLYQQLMNVLEDTQKCIENWLKLK